MSRARWAERILWFIIGIGIGFFMRPVAVSWLHDSVVEPNPDPMVATSFGWQEGGSSSMEHKEFAVMWGGVENISEKTLEGITVEVTFWSAVMNPLGTWTAPAKQPTLRPGEWTDWEVRVPWKGVMTGGGPTVRFKDASGRELPHVLLAAS